MGQIAKEIRAISLSLFSGIVGGATILVFGAFVGRRGPPAPNTLDWNPAIIPVGLFTAVCLEPLPDCLPTHFWCRNNSCGFLGAFVGPGAAYPPGNLRIFVALLWTKIRLYRTGLRKPLKAVRARKRGWPYARGFGHEGRLVTLLERPPVIKCDGYCAVATTTELDCVAKFRSSGVGRSLREKLRDYLREIGSTNHRAV